MQYIGLMFWCTCAPQLTQAAEYFGFDEQEKDQYLGGYVMAAFFIVGAPSALLVRRWVYWYYYWWQQQKE